MKFPPGRKIVSDFIIPTDLLKLDQPCQRKSGQCFAQRSNMHPCGSLKRNSFLTFCIPGRDFVATLFIVKQFPILPDAVSPAHGTVLQRRIKMVIEFLNKEGTASEAVFMQRQLLPTT
jgi:hypothetical protein